MSKYLNNIFLEHILNTNPFGPARYLKKKITSSHFMNNYNGYIKIK